MIWFTSIPSAFVAGHSGILHAYFPRRRAVRRANRQMWFCSNHRRHLSEQKTVRRDCAGSGLTHTWHTASCPCHAVEWQASRNSRILSIRVVSAWQEASPFESDAELETAIMAKTLYSVFGMGAKFARVKHGDGVGELDMQRCWITLLPCRLREC